MLKFFVHLMRDRRGNIAITLAITIVPLMAMVGASVDYGDTWRIKSLLQNAADSGALAGAALNSTSDSARIEIAERIFGENIAGLPAGISASPSVSVMGDAVTVGATTTVPTSILAIMHIDTLNVSVSATAARNAGAPICLLALNPTAGRAIDIHGSSAAITAIDCAVHANSSDPFEALYGNATATSTAALFCAHGGYSGTSFSPTPQADCDTIPDPYTYLPVPPMAGCDFTNEIVSKDGEIVHVTPGVYCGGLRVLADEVIFDPGLYVMKDGPLEIQSKANVSGAEVAFYFSGAGVGLKISSGANVNLTGPTSGTFAGLVFVQDRNSNPGYTNKISGQAGVFIGGTLYFPTQALSISGNGAFGAISPYMPIIADTFEYNGNGTMTVQLQTGALGIDANAPSSVSGARLIK